MHVAPFVGDAGRGIGGWGLFFAKFEVGGFAGHFAAQVVREGAVVDVAACQLDFLEQVIGEQSVALFRIALCSLVALSS